MRIWTSVRLAPQNLLASLFAALVFAVLFCLGAPASAFDDEAAPVEEPADVAPEGAEAGTPSSQAPSSEAPSAKDSVAPRALDRSLFRPDLKTGSEAATPPQSGQEGNQGGLEASLDALPLPSPADRPRVLGELYVHLSKAKDAEAAAPIIANIEALWRVTGSATVDLLISRGERFTKEKDLDLALQILDATVAMAPEDAEGWYLRAKVYYLQSKYDLALADLKRALDRDPQHYRALEDLGLVLEALGTKKEALEAYRKALEINPFLEDAHQAVEFLSREVGSRNL